VASAPRATAAETFFNQRDLFSVFGAPDVTSDVDALPTCRRREETVHKSTLPGRVTRSSNGAIRGIFRCFPHPASCR
jgi:hypothetical protein